MIYSNVIHVVILYTHIEATTTHAKLSWKELSENQNALLIRLYLTHRKPSRRQKASFAASLNLTRNQVNMWFQRMQMKLNNELIESKLKGDKF